ncbi:MAG: hypothetical protein ACJ8CG_09305, partial [Microvirga sp.]
TMAEAWGIEAPGWTNLSEGARARWLAKAHEWLSSKTPLDISKPLKTREGLPVENVRLDDDGLRIVAFVPAWRCDATFGIDGRDCDDENPADLVYA